MTCDLAASSYKRHVGRHALRDESCQKYFEDHNREERHGEGKERFAKAEYETAPMAHSKSKEPGKNVKASRSVCYV